MGLGVGWEGIVCICNGSAARYYARLNKVLTRRECCCCSARSGFIGGAIANLDLKETNMIHVSFSTSFGNTWTYYAPSTLYPMRALPTYITCTSHGGLWMSVPSACLEGGKY